MTTYNSYDITSLIDGIESEVAGKYEIDRFNNPDWYGDCWPEAVFEIKSAMVDCELSEEEYASYENELVEIFEGCAESFVESLEEQEA